MFKAIICGRDEEYNYPFIPEKYFLLKIVSLIFLASTLSYLLIDTPVVGSGVIQLTGDFKIEEKIDEFGLTRLHRAVIHGKENIVILLVRNGADPDATDNYGWSSLHWANFLKNDDIVKVLIANNASKDLRSTADWFIFKKGSLPEDVRRGP